jgi:hypothetical protein
MKTMLTFVALLSLLMFPSAFVPADVHAHLTSLSRPPASITAIEGTPQSAQVNTEFPVRFRVLVRDSLGNPVPGVTVTWTPPVSGPSGTFVGGINTAVTDSNGIAISALFTANLIAGRYVVLATAQGVVTPAFFHLTNTSGSPASITPIAGTPQSTRVNTIFPIRFRLVVRDVAGNPIRGMTTTWTAPSTGPSGSFEGGVGGTTDTNGIVEAPPFRANSIAGSYVVSATIAGVVTPALFSLTNLPGLPAIITAIAGTPQATQVNTFFSTPFQVLVRDSFSNPIPGVTVTWTPPVRGASGTFLGGVDTAMTNASGTAIAVRFKANDTAGTYSVPARVQGLGEPRLFLLTNIARPLSVENQTQNLIPDRFALQQNYPNPFNPTTRIEYAIPKASHVSLQVFDLLGREVATLVDEVQSAGFKSVEFDADRVASGVYFYRLRGENSVLSNKMILAK